MDFLNTVRTLRPDARNGRIDAYYFEYPVYHLSQSDDPTAEADRSRTIYFDQDLMSESMIREMLNFLIGSNAANDIRICETYWYYRGNWRWNERSESVIEWLSSIGLPSRDNTRLITQFLDCGMTVVEDEEDGFIEEFNDALGDQMCDCCEHDWDAPEDYSVDRKIIDHATQNQFSPIYGLIRKYRPELIFSNAISVAGLSPSEAIEKTTAFMRRVRAIYTPTPYEIWAEPKHKDALDATLKNVGINQEDLHIPTLMEKGF